MKVYENVSDLIGNTPLVRVHSIQGANDAVILGKLESSNPFGSVKDRIALAMIIDAEKKGLLTKEKTIIEPTSGNTGIALAAIAAVKGYKIILTMPETMSIERRKLLAAYGAEIVLTEGAKGMKGAIAKAEELTASNLNYFMPMQFANKANPEMHKQTTAVEIWDDTDGKVDIVIAGVGTGGTISGIGQFLKSKKSSVKIIAIEPDGSPVLSGGSAGPHKLQGIGAGFIPENLDRSVIDEVIRIKEDDAGKTARFVAKSEALLVGISSGAALYAASLVAQRPENKGKTIVVILPSNGERYLSTWLFE